MLSTLERRIITALDRARQFDAAGTPKLAILERRTMNRLLDQWAANHAGLYVHAR